MKRIIEIGLVLLITSVALGVSVPPELGPEDVPFPYDPNMCMSSVMDWQVVEPGIASIYSVGSHNKWGLETEMTTNDPNILVQKLEKVKDPEGGWNQWYQCMFTYSREGVHYVNVTATDKKGRTESRTLVVLAVMDDPPFIFPGSPVSDARIKDAQRFWQVAAKKGYPVTKPTRVLN